MLQELIFALKLKKAADKGWPLIMLFYPDNVVSLVFPEAVTAGLVKYLDPRAKRYRTVAPTNRFYIGRIQIIPVVPGYPKSLGYDALGALLAVEPDVRREIQQQVRRKIEQLSDDHVVKIAIRCGLPVHENTPVISLRQQLVNLTSTLMGCARVLSALHNENLTNTPEVDIPPPLSRLREIFDYNIDDVVTAAEQLAMAQIADVLGKLAFYKPRFDWKKLILAIIIAVVAVFMFAFVAQAFRGFIPATPGGVTVP
ncbi:MAG: hypothetical protein QXT64_02205 [Desulfurococcaceae archaeon]